MSNEKMDFSIDDEFEKLNSFEYQLDHLNLLNIGNVNDTSDVYTYMLLYKNRPFSFACNKIEEPTYIERYDVFEVKLNTNCDLIEGFHILGCPNQEIEYVELFLKLQEKKPRSLIRFRGDELFQNQITPFLNKYWNYLPNSFLKNKPEYFLEIQLKDGCSIFENEMVRIQLNYVFLSNQVRKQIQESNQVQIGNRILQIEDKNLKLI